MTSEPGTIWMLCRIFLRLLWTGGRGMTMRIEP